MGRMMIVYAICQGPPRISVSRKQVMSDLTAYRIPIKREPPFHSVSSLRSPHRKNKRDETKKNMIRKGQYAHKHLSRNDHQMAISLPLLDSSPRRVYLVPSEMEMPSMYDDATSQAEEEERIENEAKDGRYEHLEKWREEVRTSN